MTAIAFIIAWLLAMLTGHLAPAAPAAVHAVEAPAPTHGGSRGPSSPSPAGRLDGGVSHLPQPTPATPTVAPAPQLPQEVDGRQIDCPDGQVGTEDAAGVVHCP